MRSPLRSAMRKDKNKKENIQKTQIFKKFTDLKEAIEYIQSKNKNVIQLIFFKKVAIFYKYLFFV